MSTPHCQPKHRKTYPCFGPASLLSEGGKCVFQIVARSEAGAMAEFTPALEVLG